MVKIHSPVWLFVAAFAMLPTLSSADSVFSGFVPGNLVVSRSVYTGDASTVIVGALLPPNCPATATCPVGSGAPDDGSYPNVWFNAAYDGSFGVTSPIFLDQITTGGQAVSTYAVPTNLLVTSFSSKSEVALNLSTDGKYLTFMGYAGVGPNAIDVSNSNTPGAVDPTNPVGENVYRAVAQLDASANLQITETNAYSGNNGRAAILAADTGLYYMTGNSNNGGGTPADIVAGAGVQTMLPTPGVTPGAPTEVGSFSIAQYGYPADKLGKDNNFRGLTIFNDTLYVTKGSGSNGINTVYQVGNAGSLPTLANASAAPITIPPGFPTTLAKNATAANPFGLFFANSNTLYVGDEGDGATADAATSTNAGLQKWVLNNGSWTRAYVLQNGLNLGAPYSVPNYPAALNPATDGLRNITGRVNSDGTVTIWAITSTISASGDQGADPNQLVMITDVLANTDPSAAASETFTTVKSAGYGEVLRGVSFTPGTVAPSAPGAMPVTASGLFYSRRTGTYSGTITVLNNTASAVTGPLYVALTNLTSDAVLTNGTTINGQPAVQVLASGVSLKPGQTASAAVIFTDPSNVAITYTPVVEP